MKKILLYYKYAKIENPERTRKEHLKFCKENNILGRIILANEGINGTVSGEDKDIERYKDFLRNIEGFEDIEFKERFEEKDMFKKIKIKVRDEIVSLKAGIDLSKDTPGKYIEPEEFNKLIKSNEEFYVVDVRNNYESYIGKFKDSIALDIDNFRDLPKGVEQIKDLKEKKIIAVCTGGIRCEKATAYLIKQGFGDVSHLHGGIVKYGKMYPDEGWEGKCYVFDEKIAIDINSPEQRKIIAKCYHCKQSCDDYINCCNAECNRQFVCCEECREKFEDACCEECRSKSRYKITAPNNARKNS